MKLIIGKSRYKGFLKSLFRNDQTKKRKENNYMLFNIEFWNTEKYLPTKRHKVLRTRCVKNSVDVEITEVEEQDFPVAFIVHDYQSVYENAKSYSDFKGNGEYKMFSEEIRTYNDKLYKPVRITHGTAISLHFESLDYVKDRLTDTAPYWLGGKDFTESSIVKESNIEECKENIFRRAEDYIIFDGKVWKICGEPIYLINTFGLGYNHGGTGFFIRYLTNPNISTNNYFNALEREDAITYGKQVAAARGDTESIERMGVYDIIEVLMPEMVRFCPQKKCSKANLADSVEEKKNTVYVVICGCVDQRDALQTFREKYPDVGTGKNNYMFCLSEEEWREKQAKDYEDQVPADIIWSKQDNGDHIPEGFAPVSIYVPSAQQIITIEEGTGDNLLPEDREEGYVDYILYYQYDLDSKTEPDGGQIMCKQYVQEKYKRLTDSIPDVLDMAYGNPHLKYVGLYNFA